MHAVPLDRDVAAEPARRRGVVGVLDLDAAVEMDRARAELVVAKRLDRQRQQRRAFFGEHGRDLALGGAVNAGVGPAGVPAVEVGLRLLERLEAQALEGGLRMADRRLDFPLAIRISDAAGQRDRAVVGEHVAVERVQGGVVDVRREHALAQIVEDDDPHGPAQPAKRLLVQLGPAARARLEGEQPDALTAIAQGEDEQPRAAVLARVRMPHHRSVAVVDLAFFSRGRHNHGVRLGRALPAERDDEAADAGVLGGKAVIVDEVAPDRHGVAAAGEGPLDQFAIGLARAGRWRASRRWGRGQRVRDPRRKGLGVGGHLTGRIWGRQPSVPRIAHDDPGGLEVGAGGLAPHARRLLDAPQRPAQPPKCQNFPSFLVAQDVGHAGGGTTVLPPRQRLGVLLPHWPVFRCRRLAGFGCRPRAGRRAEPRA